MDPGALGFKYYISKTTTISELCSDLCWDKSLFKDVSHYKETMLSIEREIILPPYAHTALAAWGVRGIRLTFLILGNRLAAATNRPDKPKVMVRIQIIHT